MLLYKQQHIILNCFFNSDDAMKLPPANAPLSNIDANSRSALRFCRLLLSFEATYLATMVPSFKFTLNNTILPGCVTVGLYDGRHPTLTCGTSGGKVLMHNPHRTNVNNVYGDNNRASVASNEDKVTFLNINNHVTAVAAGPIDPKLDGKDILCVGTRTKSSCIQR